MNIKNKKTLWLFPLLLVLYEISLYLSNDAYLPALPAITTEFANTLASTQLTLTLWFLGACSTQLVIGFISDRYGRRPTLFLGGLVFVLSTFACAMANHMSILLIARFLQGASIPTLSIAGYATIHELFDQKKAIKTLAFMNGITVLAPSLGPLLGGLLLYFINWHWLFGILTIWAAVALLCLWKTMPETLPIEKQHPIDFRNIMKNYWALISNSVFMINTLISGCAFGAMIAWICASSFFVIVKFHYSFIEYGIIQAIIFGGFILGTRIVNRTIEHFSLSSILRVGMLLIMTSSIAMVVLCYCFSTTLMTIIVPMFFLALGSGLCFAILSRLAVEASDVPMGSRMAVSAWLTTLFAVIGSLIASSFETSVFAFSVAVFVLALIGSLLYIMLVSRVS
ncbi:MAG: Bcr/CflA family efflux MFS transporter [Legionellales bacterium]|nr:Bcr/CflA family efflux MFS transporter [Legionellales bacterium]